MVSLPNFRRVEVAPPVITPQEVEARLAKETPFLGLFDEILREATCFPILIPTWTLGVDNTACIAYQWILKLECAGFSKERAQEILARHGVGPFAGWESRPIALREVYQACSVLAEVGWKIRIARELTHEKITYVGISTKEEHTAWPANTAGTADRWQIGDLYDVDISDGFGKLNLGRHDEA